MLFLTVSLLCEFYCEPVNFAWWKKVCCSSGSWIASVCAESFDVEKGRCVAWSEHHNPNIRGFDPRAASENYGWRGSESQTGTVKWGSSMQLFFLFFCQGKLLGRDGLLYAVIGWTIIVSIIYSIIYILELHVCIQIWINQLLLFIEKFLPLPGFEPQTSRVPSRCADKWAICRYPSTRLHNGLRVIEANTHVSCPQQRAKITLLYYVLCFS